MEAKLKPLLGITMGDPTGVGSEIIVKAFNSFRGRAVVIGDAGVMKAAAEIVKSSVKINTVHNVGEAKHKEGTIDVIDLHNVDINKLVRGKLDPAGGAAAYSYVELAVRLAMKNEIHAVVTAPLNKEALNLAGYNYAGHTEILADLCKVKGVVMMLAAGRLRVSHVSTHLSLRQACDRVKKDRIVQVIRLTEEAVRAIGKDKPRIGVAGLNPHCGEGGLFGDEEIREIAPAVNAATETGLNVTGPLPSDTVFLRGLQGEFDAVIAMYHDQGHIAVKMAGFDKGVDVTLGLPIIRTSVDHGTAFDKAGKGTASENSLLEAMRLAEQMSSARKQAE
jgi:4-phospho-D-threonate 3-dehydrogenase / 4-phospho-D-erythronate 3-dehydrogenase